MRNMGGCLIERSVRPPPSCADPLGVEHGHPGMKSVGCSGDLVSRLSIGPYGASNGLL